MKAMLLAAGRGDRMRPLTDHIPKPLIDLVGKPIIVHLIEKLAKAGIVDLVINHSWLGDQIVQRLDTGATYGVNIEYSPEPQEALDTGGGIVQALRLFGDDPFIVCNADIWTDYDFSQLPDSIERQAHLVMIDNPPQHTEGDFVLRDGLLHSGPGEALTFSGIGMYRADLFKDCRLGKFPLAPLLRQAMDHQLVSGEHYRGQWHDIGTPQRLAELEQQLQGK